MFFNRPHAALELRTGAGQHKDRVRELQEAIAHLRTQLDNVQVRW